MDTTTIRAATANSPHAEHICAVCDIVDAGRGWIDVDRRTLYINHMYYCEQPHLLGLQALYRDHVIALVTHDLSSAIIKNLGDWIATVRLGDSAK